MGAVRAQLLLFPLRRAIAPAVGAIAVVAVWQVVVRGFHIGTFLLPAPSGIGRALVHDWTPVSHGAYITLKEVLLGILLGTASGVATALVIARFRNVATPLLAVAVVINCAPIVALAPIANNWFGVTTSVSKAAVAAVMVFFPVMVNTTRGLIEIGHTHEDVMTSVAATQWQTLRYVRLPHCLPYLFTALRLGTTLSIIGVIVTEYFGGRADALGVYIAQMAALTRYPDAWAGIVIASGMGLSLFAAVVVLERVLIPWYHEHEIQTS